MTNLIQQYGHSKRAYRARGSFCFGIYPDNPYRVKDVHQCRAEIGFFFTPRDMADREAIINDFSKFGYRHETFPETQCLSGDWTLVKPEFIGYMLAPKKWYGALWDKELNDPAYIDSKEVNGECTPGIEVYNGNTIEFYHPL